MFVLYFYFDFCGISYFHILMIKVKKSAAPLMDAQEIFVEVVKSYIGMIHVSSIRLFARELRKNFQVNVAQYAI